MTGSYVLVTAARNEARHIRKTLTSVARQTVRPKRWVIVDDGSTDETGEIIRDYARHYDFILPVAGPGRAGRSFAAKVEAFAEGVRRLGNIEYEFIGNLDADISLVDDYYENILAILARRPRLGIAGGVRLSHESGRWRREISSPWSVCAGIQLFRRQCYREVGGYLRLERVEDCVAEVAARMLGWEVEAFPALEVFHHRPGGGATGSILRERFLNGQAEHSIGYLSAYMVAKSVYRLGERPLILGSLARLAGYLWGVVTREKRVVDEGLVRFLRLEQKQRMARWLKTAGAPFGKRSKPQVSRG